MWQMDNGTKRAGNSRRTRCGLETLEGRRLFAVAVAWVEPDMLIFSGDAQNDTVYIEDNGNGMVQGFVTNAAGAVARFGPVAGIREMHVGTGEGNDTVAVRLTGDMTSAAAAGGVRHGLLVVLGAGDDNFRYDATADIDVSANDLAWVAVRGDAGRDALVYAHRGELDGRLSVSFSGGEDQDRLYTYAQCDAGSSGIFNAVSDAGSGKDRVDLIVRKASAADPIAISASAASGADADFDELTRTALVSDDGLFSVVNIAA